MAAVPGTHILTNVAPEEVAADLWPELFRDSALEFNSQFGDTPGRIHDVGFDQRSRGAGLEARRAGPAAVRSRRVRGELEARPSGPRKTRSPSPD